VVIAALVAVAATAGPVGATGTGAASGRGTASTHTAAGPSPRSSACPANPFRPGFASYLAQRWPHNRFSADVYDTRTGCDYQYRPDLRITTASVEKAEILAGVLLRAQSQGRGLTAYESNEIRPMISVSDNAAATSLWSYLGGIGGMSAIDREFGLTQTVQASPWGLTSTSALDRTRLIRQMILGQYGPLTARYRAIAQSYMLGVTPSQRWGITAGVPAGSTVPLKNGFAASNCCGWRINSSGAVERPDGSAYAVTILSDGWSGEAAGIPAVDTVSEAIADSLAGPYRPFAAPATFVDRQLLEIEDRTPAFAESFADTRLVGGSRAYAAGFIANSFASSAYDRTGGAILRLYLGALERVPDGASFAWRLSEVRTHRETVRSLAQEFATTTEFNGAQLLAPGDFVDKIVRQATGRAPGAASKAEWVSELEHGQVTRGEVVVHYTESDTSRFVRAHAVQALSVDEVMLGHAPSAGVLAKWVSEFDHGTPFTTMIDTAFRSAEYAHRVG
jgi:hypothetical protein